MSALIALAANAAVAGSVAISGAPVHSSVAQIVHDDTMAVFTGGTPAVNSANQLSAVIGKLAAQNADLIRPGMKFVIPVSEITAKVINHYTVRNGDTLAAIAARFRTPGGWESIFADNKRIGNPNVITVGMTLTLPAHAMFRHYSAPVEQAPVAVATAQVNPVASSTYLGSGAMEQCIISRESGGNSQIMNSSGHYGLYQFSESTWIASGGSAATFGHASVAEQEQVFRNAVAARGYSDWAAYDGC